MATAPGKTKCWPPLRTNTSRRSARRPIRWGRTRSDTRPAFSQWHSRRNRTKARPRSYPCPTRTSSGPEGTCICQALPVDRGRGTLRLWRHTRWRTWCRFHTPARMRESRTRRDGRRMTARARRIAERASVSFFFVSGCYFFPCPTKRLSGRDATAFMRATVAPSSRCSMTSTSHDFTACKSHSSHGIGVSPQSIVPSAATE